MVASNCEAQSYSPMNVLWLKLSTEHSTHTPQMFHEHPAMFSSIISESAALYSYMPHTMCTCCGILPPTTVHTLCITTHLLLMKRQQIHGKCFKGLRTVTAHIISIGPQTWVSPIYQAPYAVMKLRFFRNHKHTQQLLPIDNNHLYRSE